MSDCFDHELDAWDSYENYLDTRGEYEEPDLGYFNRSGWGSSFKNDWAVRNKPVFNTFNTNSQTFVKDEFYYHDIMNYKELINETEKAYLFEFENYRKWLPKRIVAVLDRGKKEIYVHSNIFNKIEKISVWDRCLTQQFLKK